MILYYLQQYDIANHELDHYIHSLYQVVFHLHHFLLSSPTSLTIHITLHSLTYGKVFAKF